CLFLQSNNKNNNYSYKVYSEYLGSDTLVISMLDSVSMLSIIDKDKSLYINLNTLFELNELFDIELKSVKKRCFKTFYEINIYQKDYYRIVPHSWNICSINITNKKGIEQIILCNEKERKDCIVR